MRTEKYCIRETAGFAQCLGAACVKYRGKIIRYCATMDEAHRFVQSQIFADQQLATEQE